MLETVCEDTHGRYALTTADIASVDQTLHLPDTEADPDAIAPWPRFTPDRHHGGLGLRAFYNSYSETSAASSTQKRLFCPSCWLNLSSAPEQDLRGSGLRSMCHLLSNR